MTLKFRKMRREDAPEIAYLHRSGPFNFDTEDIIKKFCDEKFDPNTVIVGEENGKIVGKMELTEGYNTRFGRFLIIGRLVVTEERRNRGIGTRFVKYAIEEARRRGASSIDLFVSETNTEAIRLYERLGFEKRDVDIHMKLMLPNK
jgi:ribosomal protein S18 acetylase RimI-like enzyme